MIQENNWFGVLPAHWTCDKISILFSERRTKVSDKDYAPLSVARIGVVPQLATAVKTDAGDNRKLVCNGDFVINSRSDRKGSCGVADRDGSVSLINIVLTPRNEWNNRYVHYLMRSQPFSEEYYRYGRGIVADLWTTRYSEMKSILLPIPPRTEQDQIVRFLDWKVSAINKMAKIQSRKLHLLEQFRDSFITRLTHYGIHKDAPLEKTEIAWLGKIPKSWHIRSFSKIARVCTNLVSPNEYLDNFHISPASIEKNSGRIIHTQTVQEAGVVSNNHRFFEGQIIYSKIRPLLNKVVIAPFDGLCSADMYPIETSLDIGYLKYFMLSQNFLCQLTMTKNRVKMPKINQDELSNVLVVFPRNAEQVEIVKKADECCRKIQNVIENVRKYVESLNELKTRLIADTVTGKIDVRNIDIPDYEFIGEESQAEEEIDAEGSENEG